MYKIMYHLFTVSDIIVENDIRNGELYMKKKKREDGSPMNDGINNNTYNLL